MASEMYAENDYFYGTTASAIGYRSAGTTRDYLDSLGIMAFTPEIRSTIGSANFDSLKNIVAENVRPMRILAWLSGAYPVIKNHKFIGDAIPNSTFDMLVELKNKGKGLRAENVTAVVTTNNSNITPITNFIEFEDIDTQATKSNATNPFQFRVSNNVQAGEIVVIEIKVVLDGVQTDLYKVPIVVGQKNILLTANAEYNTTNFISSGNYGTEVGTETTSTDAWGRDSADSYSGAFSFSESINGLSSKNQSAYYTTKSIGLNSINNLKVQFAAKWSIGHFDKVRLQIEYNNNNEWIDVETYAGTNDWIFKVIDLATYIQGSFKLRFWHNSVGSKIGDGFYFDDFEVVNYTEPKYITVTNPTIGDVFSQGENINIRWEDNIPEDVEIRLYRGNQYYIRIAQNTASNGTYNYTIPTTIPAGEQYRIYIKSRTMPTVFDYSDYFSIQTATASQPDLSITNCSVSISGNTVTISNVRVENIGTGAAAASTLGYYFSSSDRAATVGNYLIGTDEVPALATNTTSLQNITINVSDISPPLHAGVYNVGVVADYDGNLAEANENNNSCYNASSLFTVTVGCKDASAHNYDANATYNDDSLCETCNDGIENGDETGIDCGGVCPNSCLLNCQQTDRSALVTFYNTTDGSNWRRKWNLDLPMNQWHGVVLNEEGCVTEINLSRNRLSGIIPAELGNLSELRELNLHENSLTGTIPGSFGNLKKLTKLALTSCSLTGQIPREFGDMERLENLYLYGNQLTGTLPSELGQLTQLKKMYVMSNNLSGCFEPGVITLCDQIQKNNLYINRNNSFDANWSDFCIIGTCYDRLASGNNLNVESYPNPFKDRTTISYVLNTTTNVSVKIYNNAGKEIEVLIDDKVQQKGRNTAVFDGTNYPAGVYYFSFENGERFEFRKLILMK